MYYHITTDDFATQEGDFKIVEVKDGLVYIESDKTLPSPFVETATLPILIRDEIKVLIEAARKNKLEEIDKERAELAQKSITYNGKKIQATDADKALLTQTIALYSAAGQTPIGFGWICEDNTILSVTLSDLVQIGGLIGNQTNEAYIKARKLKDKVLEATTINEINSYKLIEETK